MISEIWVSAYRRRCDAALIQFTMLQKGSADAGAVYIKVYNCAGGAIVLAPVSLGQGDVERQWMVVHGDECVEENIADAYLRAIMDDDRDAWIIELEDPQMRHLLEDAVVSLD